MPKQAVAFNWSGGKDSALALHYILQDQYIDVKHLVTIINNQSETVATHGLRSELLIRQANSIGIALNQLHLPEMPSMKIYEVAMKEFYSKLKANGITHVVFGDIFLEDLKAYRVKQFAEINMQVIFPLWKKDSLTLVKDFIALGYRSIVIATIEELKDFCGRIIDRSFLDDLPKHIDPAGENGEFHTFVFDGPIFQSPIDFRVGDVRFQSFLSPDNSSAKISYCYLDLHP